MLGHNREAGTVIWGRTHQVRKTCARAAARGANWIEEDRAAALAERGNKRAAARGGRTGRATSTLGQAAATRTTTVTTRVTVKSARPTLITTRTTVAAARTAKAHAGTTVCRATEVTARTMLDVDATTIMEITIPADEGRAGEAVRQAAGHITNKAKGRETVPRQTGETVQAGTAQNAEETDPETTAAPGVGTEQAPRHR